MERIHRPVLSRVESAHVAPPHVWSPPTSLTSSPSLPSPTFFGRALRPTTHAGAGTQRRARCCSVSTTHAHAPPHRHAPREMQDMVTRNPSFPDGPMSPDMESMTGLLVREEVMHWRRPRTAWPCLGGRTADSQVRPWPLRHFCSHPLHRVLPTASGGGGATRSLRRCYGRCWILLDAIIARKFCYKSSVIVLQ